MRSKKTILNTFVNLLLQITSIIAGFILPRLILSRFGSQYNGIITSITQFLACAVLLRSGIGGATRVALYESLAENNKEKTSSIIKATDIFMKKIGIILIVGIIICATIYPFFVKEFSWFFTFSLFIIIGIGTFAESFFGITYLILLQADQKLWIASLFNIISVALNICISAILIFNDFSIHWVKAGSTLAFCVYPILLNVYVKYKYDIDTKAEPDNNAISQRWDAFWHQVAVFVNNNTDVIILTIFKDMYIVSIYTVYNLILAALKNIVMAFSNGLEAAFGNMIAKKEKKALEENLLLIECVIYNISTFIYVCAILLILDFVKIYTSGINDANYTQVEFSYILLIAQFFYCIRIPYQMIIQAAGHYKQTKKGAIMEAIINICISIVLVIKLGLIGIAIGTLVSMIYRTIQLAVYMNKNIIRRKNSIVFKKILIAFLEGCLAITVIHNINFLEPSNYVEWIGKAVVIGLIMLVIVLLGGILFYRKEMKKILKKIMRIIMKGKK